jgi:hypothetical protein
VMNGDLDELVALVNADRAAQLDGHSSE